MATIGSSWLNLIDMMKASNPKGGVWPVAEVLSLTNPILDDAIAVECNNGQKHTTSIRTGLPSVSWGALYEGTPQSKSTRQNVDDTTGFMEAMSSVDTRLLDLYPDREGPIRLSEAMAFMESMNQEMASSLFYSDTATTPKKFKGIGARYNKIGGAGSGNQIIDAGGTGADLTSIWFVTWSENATHLIYPQGTQAGIKREELGRQRVLDSAGNPYFVKEEKFTWHTGVSVRDWRYNVRIANIDISDLQAGTVDIYKFLRTAYYRLHSRRIARPGANFNKQGGGDASVPMSRIAIYANTDVLEALDVAQTNARGGSTDNFIRLVPKEIEGKEVLTFRGIPIRETDALLNTEARVV